MGILKKAFEPHRRSMSEEIKDVKRLCDELEDQNLTDWETEFVASIQDRITLYQGETHISDAQGDWLNRLADKYDLSPA